MHLDRHDRKEHKNPAKEGRSSINPLEGTHHTNQTPAPPKHETSPSHRAAGPAKPEHADQEHHGTHPGDKKKDPKGGSPEGTPTGNSTTGTSTSSGPTTGTNPTGGDATDHSGAPRA